MAALDWVVLIVGVTGIIYCVLTMPYPMIVTQEQWLKLPKEEKPMDDSE